MPVMESIDIHGHHGVAIVAGAATLLAGLGRPVALLEKYGAALDSAITALSSRGLEVRSFVSDLTHTAAVQREHSAWRCRS